MTPKEVLEKFKIVKGRAEPRHEVIDVEGNFDRIVYNERSINVCNDNDIGTHKGEKIILCPVGLKMTDLYQ